MREQTDFQTLRAVPVPIRWDSSLSIYASERFLRAVGDEFGWIGGINNSGELRCILPYTIIRKPVFRMARFRVETIPLSKGLSANEEKSFLNSAVEYLRSIGADMIIPATTNSIFRTYPDGAIAVPYGSYIIDLSQPEDVLWNNISHKYRKDIRTAINKEVHILSGIEHAETAHSLIRETFKRSRLRFMGFDTFKKILTGLGENMKLLIAEYQGVPQSCTAFHFSDYCAYSVHGGSIAKPIPGAMKLIQWEGIRRFRALGVKRFDLVGSRIKPEKGSKQEGIMLFKQYLGGRLNEGYIWKYPLNPLKYVTYSIAIRLLRGGDIVDQERRRLDSNPGREV